MNGRATVLALRRHKTISSWTDADDAFLRGHYAELGAAKCAAQLGRTAGAVSARATALELSFRAASRGRAIGGRAKWTDQDDAELRALWPQMRNEEIAQRLRRSLGSVVARAIRLGLKR